MLTKVYNYFNPPTVKRYQPRCKECKKRIEKYESVEYIFHIINHERCMEELVRKVQKKLH